jgi:hypothetical protein
VRSRLAALLVLGGIIVPASTALGGPPHQPRPGSGSIGIRLVDLPAHSRDDPLARSYIVGRLAPGTSISRLVEISNSTATSADVAVYAAAAGLRHGTFSFAQSHSRNELSGWTSVSRDLLRLPSRAKALETVTIDVPAAASDGERYAVIWAEVSAPAGAPGGVTLVNRVGLRMYLSVGSGGAPTSNFVIGPLTADRSAVGMPLVVATIRNTGKRTLAISGSLTLAKGPGGLRAGPFPAKLKGALAPDDSDTVIVRLDNRLPRGPWRAHMRLRNGSTQRTAAATITFPPRADAGKPGRARVVSTGSRHLVLVAISLILLAVTASVLFLFSRLGTSGIMRP